MKTLYRTLVFPFVILLTACNYYEVHLNEAKQAMRDGDYEKALAEADKAVQSQPQQAEAYNLRGVAYQNLNQAEKAKKDFLTSIKLDSSSYKAFYNLGRIEIDENNHLEAIQYISRAIRLNASEADLFNNRGVAYQAIGQNDLAIEDFTEAIRVDSASVIAYSNRAKVFQSLARWNEAIADYTISVSLAPGNGPNLYWLADTYFQVNDPINGCHWMKKARDAGYEQARQAIEQRCGGGSKHVREIKHNH